MAEPAPSDSAACSSSSPNPSSNVLSVDTTTADRRRIYREEVEIPSVRASAAPPASEPSIDAPPVTVGSIPEWAPFFCDETNHVTPESDPSALVEEHARRYANSVGSYLISAPSAFTEC